MSKAYKSIDEHTIIINKPAMCLFFIFKTEDQDTHNVISRFRTSVRSRYPGFFAASREFTPDEMLHPNPHIFFGTQESPTHPPPVYEERSEPQDREVPNPLQPPRN